jgi:hypothetical protein
MYCISSASERKHEIACTSWSSCLWKLCELVPIVEEQLCIVFMYTGTPISSPVIQKCVHLKCFFLCVWCLDNWFRILSGKPFNTFSMARLKTLQLHLTLTPLFTATHTLFVLSFTIFFSWSVIGVFGLFSCDPRFMVHIDSPWFVKFLKMANINFRESSFWFFFINWYLWLHIFLLVKYSKIYLT